MAGREARRNNERLEYKFIVKYVKNLHNDIYQEAFDLYLKTKKANPNVKDLTKTEQFMSVAMPGIPVPRYYTTRNLRVNKPTNLVQGGPTMVLEIPLEKRGKQQQSAPVVSSTQPLLMTEDGGKQSAPVVPSTQPLLLPEDVYQQLLGELQKDPELEKILNDFQHFNNDFQPTNNNNNAIDDDDDMNPELEKILNDFQHFNNDFQPTNNNNNAIDDDDDMNPLIQCELFSNDEQSLVEMDLH